MMKDERRVVSPWNIANILTVLRLALVPFFVVCLFLPGTGWRVTALAVFAVASITDHLDGELARRYGLITDFGKIADPIADKALTGAAMVCLSILGELPWWVTGVILGRELGITEVHVAAARGHPGQLWRQGQDGAADRRDRPLSPAVDAGHGAVGGDGGGPDRHGGHRRRLCDPGREVA
jgi:phosphatidylglycerophosphate synthase